MNSNTHHGRVLQAALGLRHVPAVFRQPDNAAGYVERCEKPARVILADADEDGAMFLVVCPADAEKLCRAGYEYA